MKYCYDYPRPAITVDAALFCKMKGIWHILLIQRGKEPFRGMWALPGGFVDMNETLEQAVVREVQEETGLTGVNLQQMHSFSAIDRDPRHRTISVVFMGIVVIDQMKIIAGDDADAVNWFRIDKLPELAFDHAEVVELALKNSEI